MSDIVRVLRFIEYVGPREMVEESLKHRMVKAVLDAGNGVLWADDSQVRETSVLVDFGDRPRTEIVWRVLI